VSEQAAYRTDDSGLSVERERRVDSLAERLESGRITLRISLEQRVRAVEAESREQIRRSAVRERIRSEACSVGRPGPLEIPRCRRKVQPEQLDLATLIGRTGIGPHLGFENLGETKGDLILGKISEKRTRRVVDRSEILRRNIPSGGVREGDPRS